MLRKLAVALALLIGLTAAAPPPSAVTAKAFVLQTYARYRQDDFCAMCLKTAQSIFDPAIMTLLRRNEQITPEGEMGAIDADPLCSCQDPGGLHARVLGVTLTGPGKAVVRVAVTFGPKDTERRDLTLSLVSVNGRWRVHDIGEEGGSFFKVLTNTVGEEERAWCTANRSRPGCR